MAKKTKYTKPTLYFNAEETLVDVYLYESSINKNTSYFKRMDENGYYETIKSIHQSKVIVSTLLDNFKIIYVLPELNENGELFNNIERWYYKELGIVLYNNYIFRNQIDFSELDTDYIINYSKLNRYNETNYLSISKPINDWPKLIYQLYRSWKPRTNRETLIGNYQSMFKISTDFIRAFPKSSFKQALHNEYRLEFSSFVNEYNFLMYVNLYEYNNLQRSGANKTFINNRSYDLIGEIENEICNTTEGQKGLGYHMRKGKNINESVEQYIVKMCLDFFGRIDFTNYYFETPRINVASELIEKLRKDNFNDDFEFRNFSNKLNPKIKYDNLH